MHSLLHGRLIHINLLEAARECVIFFEHATEFIEGGRPDTLQLTTGQGRLEEVGRIQRAARCGARTNDGVYFIDEQNPVRVVLHLFEHGLQALLEITAILGASQQSTHIERIDDSILQNLGHITLSHAPSQTLGNGGLANTRFADQQRIVFATTA